jgi:hypothetical protein
MPTIEDAERVFHLNNERYLLQRVDVRRLEVTIGDTPQGPFTIKHLEDELLDLLRRDRDLQLVAIEKEIRSLGFTGRFGGGVGALLGH